MNLAVGNDSHAGMQASTDHRRAGQAYPNARLTGRAIGRQRRQIA